MSKKPAILITGASGGLARIVVNRLESKFELVGVDPRPLADEEEFPGRFELLDYRQRKMAEVFRQTEFHALVHLGRVPVTSSIGRNKRYNLNVLGTRNLLELAARYGIKNVIVGSTFHVYGAHQHNHLHITEEDPLRASQIFPELADAVELDNVSTAFLLKHREIRTVVLRPVNIVGPRIRNQISQMLRSRFCPVLLGYDPMQQFIHENDIARAIELALEGKRGGVYNVAGEGVLPYSRAISLAGAKQLAIPHFIVYPAVGTLARLGSNIPKHLLDYFRYPTIISDEAFRRDFGYQPYVSTVEALRSIRE